MATSESWKHSPPLDPRPIPCPYRLWTEAEWARIRDGFVPQEMEEKWFAFVDGNRLFLHRSWTGYGIYEATFAKGEGGWRIVSAVVESSPDVYERGDDERESRTLEQLITGLLLDA